MTKSNKHWKTSNKYLGPLLLVVSLLLAISSREISWIVPADSFPVKVGGKREEVDTANICLMLKDDLLKTGLIIDLQASLPRDDNDYELFSTSADLGGLFISINEQRQFILYFGKESAGYEISMPDPEFIADVARRRIDASGDAVVDRMHTTVFVTRLGLSTENIAIEAFTSSPFLSSVVKTAPLTSLSNIHCSESGNLGLEIGNSTAAISVTKTGTTSKTSILRPVYIKRSIASLFLALWLLGLWLSRKSEDAEQVDHA